MCETLYGAFSGITYDYCPVRVAPLMPQHLASTRKQCFISINKYSLVLIYVCLLEIRIKNLTHNEGNELKELCF